MKKVIIRSDTFKSVLYKIPDAFRAYKAKKEIIALGYEFGISAEKIKENMPAFEFRKDDNSYSSEKNKLSISSGGKSTKTEEYTHFLRAVARDYAGKKITGMEQIASELVAEVVNYEKGFGSKEGLVWFETQIKEMKKEKESDFTKFLVESSKVIGPLRSAYNYSENEVRKALKKVYENLSSVDPEKSKIRLEGLSKLGGKKLKKKAKEVGDVIFFSSEDIPFFFDAVLPRQQATHALQCVAVEMYSSGVNLFKELGGRKILYEESEVLIEKTEKILEEKLPEKYKEAKRIFKEYDIPLFE